MAERIRAVKASDMAHEIRSPGRPASAKTSRPVSSLLVFLLLFVIYNVNFRSVHFGDTAPARVQPFCLLLDHTFYLDHWIDPIIASTSKVNGTYYLSKSHGHWMSAYPIIMPLAITPLYVLPAWLVARQNPPLSPGDIVISTLLETMEKLSASLIAALSGVVLYLALRKIISANLSLLVTLVYGLAGSTWSISSQGLWRHGFTQLCFAGLLWGLFRDHRSGGRAFWCGLALAAAAANKSADVIFALPFLIHFARQGRREFARLFAPLAVLGTLVLAYNFYFFGRFLGGYPSVVVQTSGGVRLVQAAPFWQAAAGLLVSPNRGLLIFMPWTVFAFWGMARAWKENTLPGVRYLIAGMAGVFVAHSFLGTWWGGWCFGPRYLSDLLPFLALFLIPVWPEILSRRLLKVVVTVAFIVSVGIQTIGAFNYPGGDWDGFPANVDQNPQRLWDWKDNQIRRTWRAGPARPFLFYGLFLLSDLVKHEPSAPRQPASKKRGGRVGIFNRPPVSDGGTRKRPRHGPQLRLGVLTCLGAKLP
jgi:hypothetical protein